MKQPSTLARKGPVRAVGFLRIRLFLCLGVLSFMLETSSNNLLLRVSKSRVAGFRSDLSFRNKGYRIGADCITKERSRERLDSPLYSASRGFGLAACLTFSDTL